MTPATQASPVELWPNNKMPLRAEEEVRKIHYIDSPAATPSATPSERSIPFTTTSVAASPVATVTTSAASSPFNASSIQATKPQPTPSEVPTATPVPVLSACTPSVSHSVGAAASALPSAETGSAPAEALPAHLASTAPSSATSTPASTPTATPKTYARKRGRPRKHPLPDPNNPAPPRPKRKLSIDDPTATAKKRAAARSAASNATSLLSVPDLGRLIPQGCSSDNAQSFIQNNLRLFADLFVALQKQASTDHAAGGGANVELAGATQPPSTGQLLSTDNQLVASTLEGGLTSTPGLPPTSIGDVGPSSASVNPTAASGPSPNKVSGPSDPIRDEIRKKMSDVTKGREAIQAEMLQMRVDASFFEHAQKTVDERIAVLRDRIAKNTALLQREREATRKAREASRKAKKDRNARQKSLKESEREEKRLAQTFMQLEREIAAEEEERRLLEQVDSSDEEQDERLSAGQLQLASRSDPQTGIPGLAQLEAFDAATLDTSPTEDSATATPSVANDTPAATDRAIGFSDEELAKVLGISTSELAGFSQTLELSSLPPPSASVGGDGMDTAPHLTTPPFPLGQSTEAPDTAAESFDVAAFLEMASSFGTVASNDSTS